MTDQLNSFQPGNNHSPLQADFSQENNQVPGGGKTQASVDMFMDVNLLVTVELGRTRMMLRQVLELQKGSVIELDRMAGELVDVFVNDRLVARGEVVVVDDKFGIRVVELV